MGDIVKLTDEQIAKLKQIELEILKTFISICEKNHIKYFLLGGSCLGAVRHKGFIPWDDDIDVGLFREDYEKFLKVAQAELPEKYFLQNRDTDEKYILNFAKIRNSETTFIEKSLSNFDINHGLYMDIFPLDGVPEGKIKEKIFESKMKFLTAFVGKCFVDANENVSLATRVIRRIPFLKVETAVKKLAEMHQRYNAETSVKIANYCGAWGAKEIVPKEYFGDGVIGEFEGLPVRIPQDYDKYLESLYGDYMTPPPPEKRVGHHYVSRIDLENSYRKYRK